nr:MAG TPA: hypothetical protein [Caudoviricetes sp.]
MPFCLSPLFILFVLARLLNARLLVKSNQIKGIEPLHIATDFFACMGVGISVIFVSGRCFAHRPVWCGICKLDN